MATVTKTFTFDSNAEGWAVTGGTNDTTLGWAATGGNPNGCLSSRIFGRNRSADPHWYYVGTWEDLGVPQGATVTHIELIGFDWRCSEWNVGNPDTQIRAVRLYDSDGSTEIAQLSTDEPLVSGTTAYATIVGTQQLIGAPYQASGTSIELWSDLYLRNANNASAAVTLLMDNFSVEITYEEGQPEVSASLTNEQQSVQIEAKVTITSESALTNAGQIINVSLNVIGQAEGSLFNESQTLSASVGELIPESDVQASLSNTGQTIRVFTGKLYGITSTTGHFITMGGNIVYKSS